MNHLRTYNLLLLTAQLVGCGTAFIGSRVEDTNKDKNPSHQAALRYHVPEDVVEVVVTLERTTTKKVVGTDDHPETTVEEQTIAVGASVNLQTIADTVTTYLLDADATGLSKNNTALVVTDTGLLSSVNAKTTGTGGVMFDNVMKIVGTVLPLVNAANGKFFSSTKKDAAAETNIKFVNQAFVGQSGLYSPRASQLDPASCTEAELFKNYFPNTLNYRFAFKHLVGKEELITQFCDTLKLVAERRASYHAAVQQYDQVSDDKTLNTLNSKITRLRTEYDSALTTHTTARNAIAIAVEQTLQQKGIGSKSERYTQRSILHLRALPPASKVASIELTATPNETAESLDIRLREAVNAITTPVEGSATEQPLAEAVKTLFNTTGIIVTAERLSDSSNLLEAQATIAAPDICKNYTAVKPCVFYRTPQPFLLTAWTVQAVLVKPEQRKMVQSDSKVVDAIPDGAPIFAIALRDSTFTKRDSTLAFSPRGRLTGLARDYGSAAEDASSSVASGLNSGINQYSSTLTSLKTIRSTENELELQPLQQELALANARSAVELQPVQAQVNLAQQQLAALSAGLSLQSTTQGQSTILQTQLTNIEQTLIAAQLGLANNQAQLSTAQTNADRTQQQAALAASTSMLAAQIAQLQNELSLLKLKQQLEELKKGP